MQRILIFILSCFIAFIGSTLAGADQQAGEAASKSSNEWQKLADGLEFGIFESPKKIRDR